MVKLTKKEQRLLDYLIANSDENSKASVNIGDICRDCHTTVLTLLTKTYPALVKKGYLK